MAWLADNPPEVGPLFFGGGSVVTSLSFVSQPQSKTVDEYAIATFNCEVAGGVAPYSYQWIKNGVNVGTNSAALSFTAAATDNAASITVIVADSAGASITSTAEVLGVTSYKFSFDGLTQSALLASSIFIPSGADFEMELSFKTTASCHLLADALSGGSDRLFVANDTRLDFAATSVTTQFTILGVTSLETVVFKRVSGVLRAYNNGVELSLFSGSNVNNNSFRVNSIGGKWGSYTGLNPFIGTYSSVKLWLGGSRTTGTLAISTKLNNKTTGAAQASITGPNATIQNYNSAGWAAV